MPDRGWVKAAELCVVALFPEGAVREAENTFPDVVLPRPWADTHPGCITWSTGQPGCVSGFYVLSWWHWRLTGEGWCYRRLAFSACSVSFVSRWIENLREKQTHPKLECTSIFCYDWLSSMSGSPTLNRNSAFVKVDGEKHCKNRVSCLWCNRRTKANDCSLGLWILSPQFLLRHFHPWQRDLIGFTGMLSCNQRVLNLLLCVSVTHLTLWAPIMTTM